MTQNEKKEYSAAQVGKIIGMHTKSVIEAIKKGRIKARKEQKLTKTLYFISQEELDRLKKELGIE
jgi:hypothetical protein